MAAPSYTEDLTDFDLCESSTGWVAYGGGGAGLGAGVDFAIQGTNCVDKQVSSAFKGMMGNNGTYVAGTAVHIWAWIFAATPGILDSFTNGGKVLSVGTGATARMDYHLEGNDTRPEGGNKCYPVKYTTTAQASDPKITKVGTPGATPTHIGGGLNTTATSKAINIGIDAVRFGTGGYITAGDAGDPATFAGFITQNDSSSNRWGILDGNFNLQGRFAIGQNNSQVATAAHFDDANVDITITDTPHAESDFTQIIFDHASTVVNWTNVNIKAEGANNPGRLVCNNASLVATIVGGTYTDIGISTLEAAMSFDGTTWRTTGLITQNNAALDNCVFDGSVNTHHLLADNPSDITGADFIFGSGHAVRCDTTGTFNWIGNSDTGYTGTRGSNAVSNSGSTDAMFYNNSGGLITLNVSGGGQAPSVRNGAGATTVVNATVSVTLTGLVNGTEVTVYLAGTNTLVDEVENVVGNQFVFSETAAVDVDVFIHHVEYYRADILGYTVPGAAASVPVQQVFDPNYQNP